MRDAVKHRAAVVAEGRRDERVHVPLVGHVHGLGTAKISSSVVVAPGG